MKHPLILIFIFKIFFCQITHGQDSLKTLVSIRQALNEQFSEIVTGQPGAGAGNYASLDLKDPAVTFSVNHLSKEGHIFGIKATGGVSDGLFSIFNNSKFNTGVSFEGQMHLLELEGQKVSYDNKSWEEYLANRAVIEEKHRVKAIEAKYQQGLTSLKFKRQQTQQDSQKLFIRTKTKISQLVKDSLDYALAKCSDDLRVLDSLILHYPPQISELEDNDNWRAIELKKLKPSLDIYSSHFRWMSFYYKISNNKFNLIDPTAKFEEQVLDSSSISNELKFQYNIYNWKKERYKTWYFNVGITLAVADNLDDLTKKEITEWDTIATMPFERAFTKKYNTYVGGYKKRLKRASIYANYYHFLFENNTAAIHLYPEMRFRDTNAPVFNMGFGLLFAIKNADGKDKPVVNAELYYNMIDISNNQDSDLRLLERNNIGLRFTFPINFTNR
ncbi:MAG: hypothetical protein JNN28_20605 [Saprospiraceae bacterium]|nr:hypothetical protein [Saprospiraceae bacterium]